MNYPYSFQKLITSTDGTNKFIEFWIYNSDTNMFDFKQDIKISDLSSGYEVKGL